MNTETNNNQRLRPPSAQPRALSLAKCIAAEIEGSFFISVFLTLLCSNCFSGRAQNFSSAKQLQFYSYAFLQEKLYEITLFHGIK